jgi:phage gp36-like protein
MEKRYGEQQLIELTDRAEEPAGVIDTAILGAALDDASAMIDSYAAKRYQVPISPTPILLRNTCATLAYFELHRGRHTEETRVAYEDALRILANISNGTMVLSVAGSEPKSAGAQVAQFDNQRQFSRNRGEW